MSAVTIQDIQAFLYREARLLDDEQWDDWLQCYDPGSASGCPRGTTTASWWKTRNARSR